MAFKRQFPHLRVALINAFRVLGRRRENDVFGALFREEKLAAVVEDGRRPAQYNENERHKGTET
eukprot:COSAG06_NODE_8222_length_2232_cov_10.556493_1_plen_63_part_10